MRRKAFTFVEIMIVVILSSVLIVVIYNLFHALFGNRSRSNLANLTKRSFLQKDARSGVRRIAYRLRESIQVLSPSPGTTSSELVFRDVTNAEIRLRHDVAAKKVVSERLVEGNWVEEKEPMNVSTGSSSTPVSWPVQIQSCSSIRYTAMSPTCITVQASLELEGQVTPLLTVVKLRNHRLAF